MGVDVDRGLVRRRSRDYVERSFRHVAEEKRLELRGRARPGRCRRRIAHRRHAAAPGAAQPALERAQVHRAGQRASCACSAAERRAGACRPTRSNSADAVIALRGHRHRHRHPDGQAADRLRGVPAGGRRHQPQVRRHRASAWRSAARSPACSAASCSSRASSAWAARSRCTCPPTTSPASSAGAPRAPAPVGDRRRRSSRRAEAGATPRPLDAMPPHARRDDRHAHRSRATACC